MEKPLSHDIGHTQDAEKLEVIVDLKNCPYLSGILNASYKLWPSWLWFTARSAQTLLAAASSFKSRAAMSWAIVRGTWSGFKHSVIAAWLICLRSYGCASANMSLFTTWGLKGCPQVPRLQSSVRDRRANWEQSLTMLRAAKAAGMSVTKTSIMLGCGEHAQEVLDAMQELRENGMHCCTCWHILALIHFPKAHQ